MNDDTIASELSLRARNRIETLLGPECREWTPPQLGAKLAEFSQLDVLRTPKLGPRTFVEIDAFLKRHGHRFTHYHRPDLAA
jgi:hypothetical protein